MPKSLVFLVVQGLRGGYHDVVACVDAHWIHVLHIAYSDAVIEAVPHDLVFDFFPASKIFFHQNLGNSDEGVRSESEAFFFIPRDTRTLSTQSKCRPRHAGKTNLSSRGESLFRTSDGSASCRPHTDLGESIDKELAVFCRLDG